MKTNRPTQRDEWTILAVVQWTADHFKSHQIDSPRATAEILLAHVLGISRIDLYLRFDQPLNQTERNRYKSLIRRRIEKEPVAYILGEKEFWSLPMIVNRNVLIPRPETECLVEEALAEIPDRPTDPPFQVLELGTGSGAIVCTLAAQRTSQAFIALDISMPALETARRNIDRHVPGVSVNLLCGDLCSAFHRQRALFDMIVSNPPYIVAADIDGLQPEVARYEPHEALNGGKTGMMVLERIILQAPDYLRSGGILIMEIGYDQFDAVKAFTEKSGQFKDISVKQDYSGLDRVVRLVKI